MPTSAELLNDISQLLPNIFIEQIIVDSIKQPNIAGSELLQENPENDEKIKISVTLSLRDIIEKDGLSQWFVEQDMQKYINVHCVLIKSENLLDEIYLSDYTYQGILKKINSTKTTLGTQIKDLKITIPNGSLEPFINTNDKDEDELIIPLSTNFETTLKEDNSFVAILAFPTFNLKDFAEKLGVTGPKENNVLSNNFSSEVIMRDGAIASEKQYFIIQDTGEFYYSQFHVEKDAAGNDVFKTGLVDGEGLLLSFQTEPNNIISDLRIRKKFGNFLQLDENAVVNNFFKGKQQASKVLKKEKLNEYFKYFSQPFISLDESGNSRFTFFFDKKNFILDNCYYKQVLDPNNIAKKVIIQDISIYRARKEIKEINSKSENKFTFVAKNKNAKTTFDILESVTPTKSSSYISELSVNGTSEKYSVKTYSVYDSQINNSNYGIYKYKVVLNVIDPTVELLKNLVSSITKNTNVFNEENGFLANLKQYYNVATSSRKLPPENIGNGISITKKEPYFNILTGKFNKFFSKENGKIIDAVDKTFNSFINAANVTGYINIDNPKLFKTQKEKDSFLNSLRNMIDPMAASPESIKVLINIVEDFIVYIQTNFSYIVNNQDLTKINNTKNNLLTIEYEFDLGETKNFTNPSAKYDGYFNALVSNGVGFKIIEPSPINNLGLSAIALKDYKSQTDSIINRYFSKYNTVNLFKTYSSVLGPLYYDFDDNFDNDDSRYTHFPISSVSTLNRKYDISKLVDIFSDQQFYLDLFLDVINYNTVKLANFSNQSDYTGEKYKTLKGREITNAQLLDIFSDPSLVNISTEEIDNLSLLEDDKINQGALNTFGLRQAGSVFGRNLADETRKKQRSIQKTTPNASSLMLHILLNELLKEQEILENAKNVSCFNPMLQDKEKNPQFVLDEKAFQLFLQEGEPQVEKVREFIKNLPVPLKFLVYVENSYSDSEYIENFFKFWIAFKKIYTIEYFDGFILQNGKPNLNKPVWKTITIEKLENTTDNIFCRIVKFKPDDIMVKYFPDIQKFELPVFDEYFYIIPNNTVDLNDAINTSMPIINKIEVKSLERENPKPDRGGPVSDESIRNKVASRDQKEQEAQNTQVNRLAVPAASFRV